MAGKAGREYPTGAVSPAWLRSRPLAECLELLARAACERIAREWQEREGGAYAPAAGRPVADTAGLLAALKAWDELLLRLLPHPGRRERRKAMAAAADAIREMFGPRAVAKGEARKWRDAPSVGRGRPREPGEDWALWAEEQRRQDWEAGRPPRARFSLWREYQPPDMNYDGRQIEQFLKELRACVVALPWGD